MAVVTLLAAAAGQALAQHATAFDVEDGARVFASTCANCHGPDGNLIAGIDLGRGQFRRPLTDNELAGIIMNGIANTPMPPSPNLNEEQVATVVAFLRVERRAACGTEAHGRRRARQGVVRR